MNLKIYAGIVSFNPDIKKLKANIDAVCPQADAVIVDDNGSDNIADVRLLCAQYPKLKLIENGENLGIAAALNILFRNAAAGGAQWLLTLDQDSCIDSNFIEVCRPYLEKEKTVSITTLWRDRNVDLAMEYDHSVQTETVKHCNTSGNLVRVSAWAEVGGFNESLFIDSVDHEFCYRLREHGYEIQRINREMMEHELGDPKRVRFLWRTITTSNHSAFRKYYICRNLVYMIRYVPLSLEFHPRDELARIIVKTVLAESNKWGKLKACVRGIRDGLRMPEYVYRPIRLDEIVGMADAAASAADQVAPEPVRGGQKPSK